MGVFYTYMFMHILLSRVLMTSRMESFAAWTGARQSLGTGAAPLFPLSTLFTETDKDHSHRLKEEHEDQQV